MGERGRRRSCSDPGNMVDMDQLRRGIEEQRVANQKPVLVFKGEKDVMISRELAEALALDSNDFKGM
jgi:hypothetical protein